MILWSLLDGFVGFNSVYHFVELNSFHQLTWSRSPMLWIHITVWSYLFIG
jgi:hypothetical protein